MPRATEGRARRLWRERKKGREGGEEKEKGKRITDAPRLPARCLPRRLPRCLYPNSLNHYSHTKAGVARIEPVQQKKGEKKGGKRMRESQRSREQHRRTALKQGHSIALIQLTDHSYHGATPSSCGKQKEEEKGKEKKKKKHAASSNP